MAEDSAGLLPKQEQNLSTHDFETANESKINMTSSVFGSTVNMCVSCVGAGVLSFPFAFKSSGMMLALILSTMFALFTYFSLQVLSEKMTVAFRPVRPAHGEAADNEVHWQGPLSFEELIRFFLGRNWYMATMILIVIGTIGGLIAYFIIIEGLCEPVFIMIFGQNSFWASRAFIICFFAYVFAFPLCCLRDFHSLQLTSLAALLTAFLVGAVVMWRAIELWVTVGIPRDLVMWQNSFSIFLTLPIFCFAWGCQISVSPTFVELSPERKSAASMRTIMIWMVSICGILYTIVGALGYGTFGSRTRGNILVNYPLSDNFANSAKVIMALHVILAYPVNMFPARRAMRIVFTCGKYKVNEYEWPWYVRVAAALLIVTITAIVAILVPRVTIVFGLCGSTVGVFLQFILPAMLLLTPQPVLEPLPAHVRRQLALEDARERLAAAKAKSSDNAANPSSSSSSSSSSSAATATAITVAGGAVKTVAATDSNGQYQAVPSSENQAGDAVTVDRLDSARGLLSGGAGSVEAGASSTSTPSSPSPSPSPYSQAGAVNTINIGSSASSSTPTTPETIADLERAIETGLILPPDNSKFIHAPDMAHTDDETLTIIEQQDQQLKTRYNRKLRADLPTLERLMAYTLFAMGGLVCITGTAINVYEIFHGPIKS